MRSNIETIKFTGAFCLLFAVLTYIVTLNKYLIYDFEKTENDFGEKGRTLISDKLIFI